MCGVVHRTQVVIFEEGLRRCVEAHTGAAQPDTKGSGGGDTAQEKVVPDAHVCTMLLVAARALKTSESLSVSAAKQRDSLGDEAGV